MKQIINSDTVRQYHPISWNIRKNCTPSLLANVLMSEDGQFLEKGVVEKECDKGCLTYKVCQELVELLNNKDLEGARTLFNKSM